MSSESHSAWLIDLDGTLYRQRPVRILMADLGERIRVVPFSVPVLDLGTRGDVAAVQAALRDVRPIL